MKNGISLIILVITIIVIVILAGAVILSLSQNNPISSSTEASFKTSLSSVVDEVNLYTLAKMKTDGTIVNPTLAEISSASKLDSSKLSFANGKVIYRTNNLDEKNWAESVGVVVDYTNGLVAEYNMNGNANDNSGNGNNGTVIGAVLTTDRLGRDNSAYNFSGSPSYIDLGPSSVLKPNSITISTWVNASQITEWNGIITNVSNFAYGYGQQLGTRCKIAGMGSGQYLMTETVVPTTNTWYNIVTTHDNVTNENKIYLNGKLINTLTYPITYEANLKTLIGAFYVSGSLPFYGKIDDVRIYNRVLSISEVASLYYIYW